LFVFRVFKNNFILFNYKYSVSLLVCPTFIFTVPSLLNLELVGYIWLVFLFILTILFVVGICKDDRVITRNLGDSIVAEENGGLVYSDGLLFFIKKLG